MATVRGMTPEAIRALLKKEIGDYQALSIAVNSAKGVSESAIAEVEKIRADIANMDINFDDSKLAEALGQFERDMAELSKSLDEVAEDALVRENKLTALELALNQDLSEFDREMQDMAQQLADSKTQLEQDLAEAAERLAQNVVEVGDKLSAELDTANQTLNESLAKDLDKLNADLTAAFGNDLKSLETRQNDKNNALNQDLKSYKSNTDAKMSTLLSDIDKAKAYSEGFLQPGNLVWNPRALDNARGIVPGSSAATVVSVSTEGHDGHGIKINKVKTSAVNIRYGDPDRYGFELKKDSEFQVSAWVKSSVALPAGALRIGCWFPAQTASFELPANTWVKIEGTSKYNNNAPKSIGKFEIHLTSNVPVGATIIVSDPYLKAKVTSDLIVDGAVTSKSIATGAVVAGKIATDAITSNNILAGSVKADRLVAGSISADQLATNAVTADKISANAVTADKIKAKSIGASQLATDAVTADKIKSNAVTATKIDANAVTAQKLAAGAVTADKIAANSVDATKLTIMPGNLFPDPRFLDKSGWALVANRRIDKAYGYENTLSIDAVSAQTGSYYQPTGIPSDTAMRLEPGASYRLTCRINFIGTNPPDRLDVYARYPDKGTGRIASTLLGGIKRTSENLNVQNGFGVGSLDFTHSARGVDSRCTVGFFLQSSHKSGTVQITDVHITRAADASLIVKGGVQADHITSGAITTHHMSANSINGDRIKAGTLDANRIKANTLSANQITAGVMHGDRIQANTLNGDRIKANTITGKAIASGTITAGNIKSGELTSDNVTIKNSAITNAMIKDLNAAKITAGVMHGDRIQANTLNGDRIKAGTLDANRIKANTLSANQIATGTLSADRLAADSITVKQLRAGTIVPIGGSLIISEPKESGGVPEPIWWRVCDTELAANYSGWPRPDGHPWRMCSTAQSVNKAMGPPKRLVKVQPGQKYRLQFWCRSTRANTKMYIEMRDQNGSHAVKSGAVYGTVNDGDYKTAAQAKESWDVADFSKSKTAAYLVSNFTLPTVATKVTSTIEFKEDVEYVYLSNFRFNHDNGADKGNQWLAGVTLELDIPDQAEIDARQDSDARFLRGVVENMARMLVRAENLKPDFGIIGNGFEGTVAHNMMGVKVTRKQVALYVRPEWTGSATVLATCSSSTTRGLTGLSVHTHDAFVTRAVADLTGSLAPPSNFEHEGVVKFCTVAPKPTAKGATIDDVGLFIRHLPTFDEMFTMLSTKIVPLTGALTYGRVASIPQSPLDEVPPWNYDHMGSSRR